MAKDEKKEAAKAGGAPEKDGEPAPKKSKKRLLIMIGAALALVLAVGAYLFASKSSSKEEVAAAAEPSGTEESGSKESGKDGEKTSVEKKSGEAKEAKKAESVATEKDKLAATDKDKTVAQKEDNKKAEGQSEKKDEGAKAGEAGPKKKDANPSIGEIYGIPRLDLNLGNPIENRYLRVAIGLEYRGGEAQLDELKKRQAQFNDIIITTVSNKTRVDLVSETGKNRLRRELLNKFNEICERPLSALYFTEFVVE